jgi:hypothetical protein
MKFEDIHGVDRLFTIQMKTITNGKSMRVKSFPISGYGVKQIDKKRAIRFENHLRGLHLSYTVDNQRF